MLDLKLKILPERLSVCRLDTGKPVPRDLFSLSFFSLTRTNEEISLVVPEGKVPDGVKVEKGWCALQVQGPLDFGLTGILAGLLSPLAEGQVSIFALSTYDTDFVLVREFDLVKAVSILKESGCVFIE